ncbi:Stf0 family sulfotransferase [Paracoccus cavernae]|uniref:Stf0 family sulfotransferase n=1 Tax=Paracoccus cavernae TaxID=1571207 RepID=UPI00363A7017
MTVSIFDPEANQKSYEFWMRTAPPSKVYSILFTPRSGSSWLTSILTQTKAMGTPSEWFNPELMKSSSQAKGARDLDQFVGAISRHDIHGNTFGFEITHHQLRAVFGSDQKFMAYFPNALFFWLIRKDIVAQGVSLDKMVQTKISHASNYDASEIAKSDRSYDYDADRIRSWISHIHAAELASEKMIADFNLAPVRLSYEQITKAGEQKVVELFAAKLGLEGFAAKDVSSSDHRKIGTEKNDAFSERFREENKEFMDQIDAERAEMLSQSA